MHMNMQMSTVWPFQRHDQTHKLHAHKVSGSTYPHSMSSWRIHMYASESFQLHHACETTWLTKPVSELACDRMIIDADSVHISELHVVFEGQNLRARYLW